MEFLKTLEPGWLRRQMQQASAGVRQLKLHSPHIFPEWQELQQAKVALQKAEERYDLACKNWHDLGFNATPPTPETPETKEGG